MIQATYKFRTKLWLYSGLAAWHFITLPKAEATQIREQFAEIRRGFGSLPVKATIGMTTWKTSIFWDSKTSSYLLPIKAAIRKKEGLKINESVDITLNIKS